jgi:hypothetical protein
MQSHVSRGLHAAMADGLGEETFQAETVLREPKREEVARLCLDLPLLQAGLHFE